MLKTSASTFKALNHTEFEGFDTMRLSNARRVTSHTLFRLSLLVSRHLIATVAILTGVAVLGGAAAGVLGDGWNSVSVFQTCYGIFLTIGIFTWTLSGYATREADRKRHGAIAFATRVRDGNFGPGDITAWHRTELATFLEVSPEQVESELLLWMVDQRAVQGGAELIAITQRHWFIRVVARGHGGRQVIDLGSRTGSA
jgi:hypothetical protein